MPKMSDADKARYRDLDLPAFQFQNEKVQAFFDRATTEGYNLDTTGFLAHPGFFQAPHRRTGLGDIDIAMVGCPLDLGAIGLSGARHGPKAVREWSRNYGPVNDATGNIPFDQCSIADFGDVEWSATDLQTRLNDIAITFEELSKAGIYTLSCGGEHTTAFGILKGLSAGHNGEAFGLVHVDAHCDSMATWGGDRVNDGSVFRQAVLNGYIDPTRTVQIGIRGRANFLWEFSHDSGMTVVTADEVYEKGMPYVIDLCKEVVGTTEKSYLSLDVDALDATIMMGTTGPEPFGLTGRQVRELILGVRDINFVGADMVELNPVRDPASQSAHLAAALYFELLSLLSDCRVVRTGVTRPTQWA